MPKMKNFTGKMVERLTKPMIDSKVSEYLRLDEEIKAKQARQKTLKEELNSNWTKENSVKEALVGNTHQWDKIPKNNGKNNFDWQKLKVILTPIRMFSKVCKKKPVAYDINVKEIENLVKAGTLRQDQVDECREDKWIYSSKGKRLEKGTLKEERKAENEREAQII